MKKGLAAACLLAAFLAGMLPGAMTGGRDEGQTIGTFSPEPAKDPLDEFRTEREQLRQMQIAQLNGLICGDGTDAEIVAEARRRLLCLMEWQEQETTLEGVLGLRGIGDALVTVHTDSVSVLVRGEGLNRQQTAVILELVMRETGISGGNIKIIPIN